MLSNYHTHTTYCDGKSMPREMVNEAIRLGMAELGFSSHSPLPGEDWCMSEEGAFAYFSEVSALKSEYADKIKIFAGIEYDYMSERMNLPFDYIIGSVHSVETPVGERFVDISSEGLLETVENYFGGDIYTLAEAYYDRVGDVVARTDCDIIGHFDLVTKFTERGVAISESHPRYIAAQDKALDRLFATDAVFEVNTGAMARGYRATPYPNKRVLQRIKEVDKPVVLSSDCHDKSRIAYALEEMKVELLSLGVRTLNSMYEILKITRKI